MIDADDLPFTTTYGLKRLATTYDCTNPFLLFQQFGLPFDIQT